MRTPHSTQSALKDEEYHYWGHKVPDQEQHPNEKQEQKKLGREEITQNRSILEKQFAVSCFYTPSHISGHWQVT